MPNDADACPLPRKPSDDEETIIRRLLRARRIAIVGLSDDPSRPSHEIGEYLLSRGKTIIPVNPNHAEVLGLKCYSSLAEVPGPIDLVNVFRRPEHCAGVARDAIAAGAKGVWLQSGIMNDEARDLAQRAGIDFVQNRCILVEHMRRGGS
jgi:predicted CoA-binding protein